MKKFLLSALVIAGAALVSSSCRMNVLRGEGSKSDVNPTVEPFNKVEIDVPLVTSITVQEGATPGIQFSGYSNVIQHLKTKVRNNTLHIYSDFDGSWEINDDGITAQITLPALAALTLSGAPQAAVHGNVAGHDFILHISGAGRAVIDNINVDDLTSEISGAGSASIKSGMVKNASYEISGAGKISAFALQTTETTASISGAGKGEVTAQQKLSASISGAGAIKYKGHPALSQDVSGAGSVADAN